MIFLRYFQFNQLHSTAKIIKFWHEDIFVILRIPIMIFYLLTPTYNCVWQYFSSQNKSPNFTDLTDSKDLERKFSGHSEKITVDMKYRPAIPSIIQWVNRWSESLFCALLDGDVLTGRQSLDSLNRWGINILNVPVYFDNLPPHYLR